MIIASIIYKKYGDDFSSEDDSINYVKRADATDKSGSHFRIEFTQNKNESLQIDKLTFFGSKLLIFIMKEHDYYFDQGGITEFCFEEA